MNQHFRAVPGIPNPLSPLAPNKNGANYELARDENVLVSVPRELLKPLRPIWREGWTGPLSPRASEGLLGGQGWGHPELGERGAGGTQNPGQSRGHSEFGEPPGLHCTRDPSRLGSAAAAAPTAPPAAGGTAAAPVPAALARCGPFGAQKPPGLSGPPGAARAAPGWHRLGSAGRGARCGFTALPGTNGFKLP